MLQKVGDVVKEGDEVSVKVVGFDRGKVKLSMENKRQCNLNKTNIAIYILYIIKFIN